jgi:hypothetical protein
MQVKITSYVLYRKNWDYKEEFVIEIADDFDPHQRQVEILRKESESNGVGVQ